jgi:CPA1 family monovalent cation:H+ antiporter
LILYRFAVAAVSTGTFSLAQASGTFALIIVGEIAFGIGVGWASLRLRRWARDPHVEITLSLLTPYVAYLIPEELGGSGVLATVAAGLYVSWNGPLLIPSATRLQGIFFWDLLIYLIEGLVFLVTGLQARLILERMAAFSLRDVIVATLLTTAIIIVARFVWVFPATYLPRWLIPPLARRDPSPPWQLPFILAYTGVRGVVSLAAALAIPYALASGAPFPHRDFILFVVFGVILLTLVGQGLTLPLVIRWLGLASNVSAEQRREQEEELAARFEAMEAARRRLAELTAERGLPESISALLQARQENRSGAFPHQLDDGFENTVLFGALRMELIAAEREHLYQLLREGRITDESRRRLERELDLEEAAIACKQEADDPPL